MKTATMSMQTPDDLAPGVTRDLFPWHEGDIGLDGAPGALLRHYQATMQRTLRKPAPTFGEVVAAAFKARTCHDDAKRDRLLATISRTMTEGLSGGQGGFAVAYGLADDVFDRARQTDGPWKRANWWPVKTYEWRFPVVNETGLASGKRFGGLTSQWGLSETQEPAPSDGKLANITFKNERLLIFTNISHDLFADSESLSRWLYYAACAEFRYAIEAAMILGVENGVGPVGVIGAPWTVVVPKDSGQTAGTITASNIDNLWAAISPENSENCVFHANKATISYIDKLAQSGQFPEGLYFPRGYTGNQYATIKGCDLIPNNFCPNVGTPGDLIAVDWSDYVLTYVRPKPTDSSLTFLIDVPTDSGHRGIVGMPRDAVEARRTEHYLFQNDVYSFAFKYRGSGSMLWAGTSADANGNVIGPAAVIAQR